MEFVEPVKGLEASQSNCHYTNKETEGKKHEASNPRCHS